MTSQHNLVIPGLPMPQSVFNVVFGYVASGCQSVVSFFSGTDVTKKRLAVDSLRSTEVDTGAPATAGRLNREGGKRQRTSSTAEARQSGQNHQKENSLQIFPPFGSTPFSHPYRGPLFQGRDHSYHFRFATPLPNQRDSRNSNFQRQVSRRSLMFE